MKDATRRLEVGESEGLGDVNPNEEPKKENTNQKKKSNTIVTL